MMRMRPCIGAVSSFVLALSLNAAAVSLTTVVGAGTRSLGLAGNYVALVNDATSFYVNPAAMAFSSARELSVSAEWHRLYTTSDFYDSKNLTDDQYLRFSDASWLRSFPTSRGGFGIGLGYISPYSFDDLRYFEGTYLDGAGNTVQRLSDYSEAGQLNMWGGGFGVQVAPGFGVGASAFLITGSSSLRDRQATLVNGQFIDTVTGAFVAHETRNYLGFDVRGGLMYVLRDWAVIGARFDLPQYIAFVENSQVESQSQMNGMTYTIPDSGTLTTPFTGAIGIAFPFPFLKVSTELRFRSPYQGVDRDIEAAFWKLGGGVGLEAPVPATPFIFRAGYSYDEFDPYAYLLTYSSEMNPEVADYTATKNRQTISGGLSWQLGQQVSLDAAYLFSMWELETQGTLSENNTDHRVSISFSLRY